MESKAKNKPKAKYTWQRFFMDLGRFVLIFYYMILPMKIYGVDKQKYRKKLRGGALILANHTSYSDPFYVGRAFAYRRMYFMAADVVLKNRFIGTLLKGMGCVPINRETYDLKAIKRIIALAKEGQTVAIFPQGGVHRDNSIQEIKNGAVLIAVQAGVPLVPMYIHKRRNFFDRPITVVGESLAIDKKMPSMAEIDAYSEEMLHRMQKCREIYDEIVEDRKHA